jgi:glycosyltransferase involved in cell wall biosynthesis
VSRSAAAEPATRSPAVPEGSRRPRVPDALRADFAVLVPAYNEVENVPDLFRELRESFARHGLAGEVILVDDGSTDGTADRAREDPGSLYVGEHDPEGARRMISSLRLSSWLGGTIPNGSRPWRFTKIPCCGIGDAKALVLVQSTAANVFDLAFRAVFADNSFLARGTSFLAGSVRITRANGLNLKYPQEASNVLV